MDLNKAETKIRNAWIAGLVLGAYFFHFSVMCYAEWGDEINDTIVSLLLTIVSLGLAFGIYKNSRICAIAMVVLVSYLFFRLIYVVRYGGFDRRWDVFEDSLDLYICVGYALLYFTFEGIRGTFAYHKLKNK